MKYDVAALGEYLLYFADTLYQLSASTREKSQN